jgi:hypothetical protein
VIVPYDTGIPDVNVSQPEIVPYDTGIPDIPVSHAFQY